MVNKILLGNRFLSLINIPQVLLIFLVTSSMCLDQDNRSSIWTPRNFVVFTFVMNWPPKGIN